MARLYQFPTTTPPALAVGWRSEYGFADVARELRLTHFSTRVVIDKLRALALHAGLPLPRTPRIVNGMPVSGPASIVRSSRWDAGEVDAWLDGRGPTTPAPALANPVRQEMRRRAGEISHAGVGA